MKKRYADGGNVATSSVPNSSFAPTPIPQPMATAPVAPNPPAVLQSPGPQRPAGPIAQSLYPGPQATFPLTAAPKPFRKGGAVKAKKYAKGGSVKASGFRSAANVIAFKGKTRGRFV